MVSKYRKYASLIIISLLIFANVLLLLRINKEGVLSSRQLISGATFKNSCKYNIDNRYPLIPYDDKIQEGDRVFMKVSDISTFIKNPPPVKLTVIVSNSDETFDNKLMSSIQPYAVNVYAINCSAEGAKQLPIGFRDNQYVSHKEYFDVLNNSSRNKNILCFVNFLISTNTNERQSAMDIFSSKKWATVDNEYKNISIDKSLKFNDSDVKKKRLQFYSTLKRTKFVVCPPGTGQDTHRIYETLLFGGIPIIKSSFLDPMYEIMGGCWIVNDWNEVTEDECNTRWANKQDTNFEWNDVSFWLS